ncbi:MAG: T9SS type A sorting domain-containing protein, partial [Bacteroidota bacterium]|nr:T9SS type A sorting domain-containing protein [Bacteroidota bacterium]
SEFGLSTVSQITSKNISLSNFPNPFSQSTAIIFTSDKPGFAQISVHNLLGTEVARLFTGELDGGKHSFTWDARGMPAGMYICRVHSAGSTQELLGMVVK